VRVVWYLGGWYGQVAWVILVPVVKDFGSWTKGHRTNLAKPVAWF
jgi:hypothetical protein